MAVLDFTLPPEKTLKICIKCEGTDPYTDIVEPLGLDRSELVKQIQANNDKVQHYFTSL